MVEKEILDRIYRLLETNKFEFDLDAEKDILKQSGPPIISKIAYAAQQGSSGYCRAYEKPLLGLVFNINLQISRLVYPKTKGLYIIYTYLIL